MKNNYIYTDLACEKVPAGAIGHEKQDENSVLYHEEDIGIFRVVTQRIGKTSKELDAGVYVTISLSQPTLYDEEEKESLRDLVSSKLRDILSESTGQNPAILVVGLGNRFLASDAIGPRCVDNLFITRHLKMNLPSVYSTVGMNELAAIAPGVLSQTGIESAEIIRGVVQAIQPDVVIAVDALCARASERLCAAIQISDTGIRPGSGVGNARAGLSRSLLGCPVISIGVPTVVRSSTLISDAVEKSGGTVSDQMEELLENGKSYYVTLNEVSEITDTIAKILADAINNAASIE